MKFGQFIDFYLRSGHQSDWNRIVQLSLANNTASDKILERYILESARLCGPLGLPRDVDPADGKPIELTVDHTGRKILLRKGDRVVTSFVYPRNLEPVNQVNHGKYCSCTQVKIVKYSRTRKIPPSRSRTWDKH